jgi:biotin operon repressor
MNSHKEVVKVGKKWTDEERSKLLETKGENNALVQFQVEYRPEVSIESLGRMYRALRREKEGGYVDEKELIKLLKRKRVSVDELADHFSVPPKEIGKAINQLREKNILVDSFGTDFQLARSIAPVEEPHKIDLTKHKEREFCFGAIADTHLGSKYERLDVLNALYDRFASYGVDTVFLGGNMIEGKISPTERYHNQVRYGRRPRGLVCPARAHRYWQNYYRQGKRRWKKRPGIPRSYGKGHRVQTAWRVFYPASYPCWRRLYLCNLLYFPEVCRDPARWRKAKHRDSWTLPQT